MPGLDSIQLKWPDDPSAVEQMRGFLSDLATCELVNDAFVDGVGDDVDATGPQRPDLADTARARLRAWDADDDAVDRAFQLATWCFREVLRPQLARLDLHVPTGFEDAASNALILGPELTAARKIGSPVDDPSCILGTRRTGLRVRVSRSHDAGGILPPLGPFDLPADLAGVINTARGVGVPCDAVVLGTLSTDRAKTRAGPTVGRRRPLHDASECLGSAGARFLVRGSCSARHATARSWPPTPGPRTLSRESPRY
jgi:hypothetical protein